MILENWTPFPLLRCKSDNLCWQQVNLLGELANDFLTSFLTDLKMSVKMLMGIEYVMVNGDSL